MNNTKNTYYIMRHAKSEANEKNIIVSSPKNGINSYGLIPEAVLQILKTNTNNLTQDTIIYTSDFKRAKETAFYIANRILTKKVKASKLLRERYFGNYELLANSNYEKVWGEDKNNPDNKIFNVESVNEVLKRILKLIKKLEKRYNNKTILLVSHGDPLQILESFSIGINPQNHRSIPHLNYAEIRKLNLKH